MTAKPHTKYAIIANGIVSQIFDSTIYQEWDEQSITAIELSGDMSEWVVVGMPANADNTLTRPSLEQARQVHLNELEDCFLREVATLQGSHITQAEINTYDTQVAEAKLYLTEKNPDMTPLLRTLAQSRGQDIAELATKIVQKNQAYNQKLMLLLGNYQKLKDQILKAKSEDELMKIVYVSPLES
ncbi:hypothetical protein [Helicobacter sp.]|uniref:hypothetical protein n=1 Tax=Helicobacter sp. TaxID=218 RepID=UPI00388DDD27